MLSKHYHKILHVKQIEGDVVYVRQKVSEVEGCPCLLTETKHDEETGPQYVTMSFLSAELFLPEGLHE